MFTIMKTGKSRYSPKAGTRVIVKKISLFLQEVRERYVQTVDKTIC